MLQPVGAAGINAGETTTAPAVVTSSRLRSLACATKVIASPAAVSSGAMRAIRCSGSPRSSPPSAATISPRRTEFISRPADGYLPVFSASITFCVMSTFGLK